MSTLTRSLILTAALVSIGALSLDASAQRRGDGGSVTACSRYGKGCVTGATRAARFDREVRLPGGTWIGCKQDCRETLREETLDFFETLRERSPDQRR